MLKHVSIGAKRSNRCLNRKENPLSLEALFRQMSRGRISYAWPRTGAEKSFYKWTKGFIFIAALSIGIGDRGGQLDVTKRLLMATEP